MPPSLIERQVPGAGTLTAEQLQGISRKSCGVLIAEIKSTIDPTTAE